MTILSLGATIDWSLRPAGWSKVSSSKSNLGGGGLFSNLLGTFCLCTECGSITIGRRTLLMRIKLEVWLCNRAKQVTRLYFYCIAGPRPDTCSQKWCSTWPETRKGPFGHYHQQLGLGKVTLSKYAYKLLYYNYCIFGSSGRGRVFVRKRKI